MKRREFDGQTSLKGFQVHSSRLERPGDRRRAGRKVERLEWRKLCLKRAKQICKEKIFLAIWRHSICAVQSCEGAPITYSNVTACLSQHLGETESTCRWQNLHWLLISPSVFPSAQPSGVVLLAALGPRLLSLDRTYVPCLWSWLKYISSLEKDVWPRNSQWLWWWMSWTCLFVRPPIQETDGDHIWSCSMP